MADWKDVYKIKKRQIVEFTGNGVFNVKTLFNGTGVTNGEIFTLNDGVILSSVSCDYATSWGISGNNLTAASQVKTWSTLPSLWYADTNDTRSKPLYLNGYHTPITIPSGFVIYVLDMNAHNKVTIYENEVPYEMQAVEGEVSTPLKLWRIYYNQTADSLTLRMSATNVKFAYLSCAYIFTKYEYGVKNKAVIMEDVYKSSSLGNGITIPPSEEGGGEETNSPNLATGAVGRYGAKNLYFDFSTITKGESNYIGTYSDVFLELYEKNYANVSHFSLPYIGFVGKGIYKFDKLTMLNEIILGSEGNPVTTDGVVDIQVNSTYSVKVYVYTTGGVSLLWTCSVGDATIYYLKA